MSREELIVGILCSESGKKRTYGTGSVFQAKNKTWYGFVTVGRDSDGKRIRKKLTGHTQEEVELKMDEVSPPVVTAPATPRLSSRPLSNRSIDQLRRMYTEIIRKAETTTTEP